MSENKSFTITGTVEKKEEREGTKGTYYTCKTEHGSVNVGQDLIDKVVADGGTAPRIGQTYTFEGVEYPPKDPKFKTGMRFANHYEPAQKSTTTAHTSTIPPKPDDPTKFVSIYEQQQNGLKFGNRLTNATALVVAQIEKGEVKPTNEEIDIAMDKLFASFDRAEKTGKFEAPF